VARLTLERLTKIFPGRVGGRDVKALDGVSLEVADREFLAIVGPSGCGKSTLLRIVAGLEDETSGRILIDGREVGGLPPRERNMAIMFQNYTLFPHMTVERNMAFGLRLRGTPAAEARSRVAEVAATLGIGDLLDRLPSELSGGQRQRAALGRAILRRPGLFLFDEPLSNLDAKMRAQLRVEISRLHRELQSTMVFVTHDQVEAMTMGDRVAVMKDGAIRQAADPGTLFDRPADTFVATFIGSPGMNLFQGRIAGSDSLVFEGGGLSCPVPDAWRKPLGAFRGREAVLGIRPEDIGPQSAGGGTAMLKGRVEVVERLGGQAVLHLAGSGAQAGRFAARVEARGWAVGDLAELPASLAKAMFFDPATGRALEP
jgi:multiple sugar transport system ATP-binding protein